MTSLSSVSGSVVSGDFSEVPFLPSESIAEGDVIRTQAIIIGAGPVGLFAVFELGLVDISCCVLDVLDMPGGQCSALYPEKPIYDIPALPSCTGAELTARLVAQAAPFKPRYFLGQRVMSCARFGWDGDGGLADGGSASLDSTKGDSTKGGSPNGSSDGGVSGGAESSGDGSGLDFRRGFRVVTEQGVIFEAAVVVIAAGGGEFVSKKPPLAELSRFEEHSVRYAVKRREEFRDKDLIIAGGGDSAVDWAVDLSSIARSVALVHRRPEYRAAPGMVARLRELADGGKVELVTGRVTGLYGSLAEAERVVGEGAASGGGGGEGGRGVGEGVGGEKVPLGAVSLASGGEVLVRRADFLLPFFGLTMQLGALADFGAEIERDQLVVNTSDFQTSIEGLFAIGDINTYDGKLKLILSGFHEAALCAKKAFAYVYPERRYRFLYTTTSSALQEKLNPGGEEASVSS